MAKKVDDLGRGRSQAVHRALKRAILDQALSPGSKLPEDIDLLLGELAGEFHTMLAQMTNNASLIRYVNELVARSSLILALYGRPHSSDCAVSEHQELLDSLIAGKADDASKLMAHHLDSITTRALLPREDDRNIKDVLTAYAAAEGLA